jgi:hypothetical protein
MAVVLTLFGYAATLANESTDNVFGLPSEETMPTQQDLLTLLEEQNGLDATDSHSTDSASTPEITDFKQLRRQFMLEQIEPVHQETGQDQAESLDELIRRLRSLNIPPEMDSETKKSNKEMAESKRQTDNSETGSADSLMPAEPNTFSTEQKSVLNRLEKASQVPHPLHLADTLYRQRYYVQALAYYEQVYEGLAKDDFTGRQWILFQMANCCRMTDTVRAVELYTELIQQYPNAKWVPAAKGRKTVIEWNQASGIEEIIQKEVDVSSEL